MSEVTSSIYAANSMSFSSAGLGGEYSMLSHTSQESARSYFLHGQPQRGSISLGYNSPLVIFRIQSSDKSVGFKNFCPRQQGQHHSAQIIGEANSGCSVELLINSFPQRHNYCGCLSTLMCCHVDQHEIRCYVTKRHEDKAKGKFREG